MDSNIKLRMATLWFKIVSVSCQALPVSAFPLCFVKGHVVILIKATICPRSSVNVSVSRVSVTVSKSFEIQNTVLSSVTVLKRMQ